MTAATVRLALNLSQSILSCCLAFCPSSAARPIAKVAADGSTRGAGAVECVDGVVASAIDDGATSVQAIGACTKAGTNCGSCRPELKALISMKQEAEIEQAA